MAKTCPICGTSYPDSSAFCANDGSTLRAAETSEDLVGSVIADRYMVSKLLGEGGMGRVYLAKHVRLPQQVAIKVLHPGMVKDTDTVARFNREAANAVQVEHDRVARVFDFGETTDGLVYLVMEFVPGKTLRELVAPGERMSPARAANLVYQIADGLDAAHRIGLVHRDLKPDNVLVVTDENGVDRSKVVDFGIAKVVDNSQTQLTQAGMLVGTPEFMSPEQVLGEQLDARSDVYALALVAYQLFTGTLPFTGTTPERSLTARLIEDPRTLLEVAPDVEWPASLQAAFDAALTRETEGRTASAGAFGEAVVYAVEGWTGAPVLRARTPMSTPALTSAAGAVTVAWSPPSAAGQETAAIASPTSTMQGSAQAAVATRSKSPMILGGVAFIAVAAAIAFFVLKGTGSGAATAGDSTSVASSIDTNATGAAGDQSRPTGSAPSASKGAVSGNANAATPAAGLPQSPPAGTPGAAPAIPASTDNAATDPAQVTLDSLRDRIDVFKDDTVIVRRAAVKIVALLPRLRTPTDSFYAELALFQSYGLLEDDPTMCRHFRTASDLAKKLGAAKMKQMQLYENDIKCEDAAGQR